MVNNTTKPPPGLYKLWADKYIYVCVCVCVCVYVFPFLDVHTFLCAALASTELCAIIALVCTLNIYMFGT